jgi:hypothetical protein
MRRVDWFLAAVIGVFLVSALAAHALGLRLDLPLDPRLAPAGEVETTVRRLVIPRPVSPLHADCPAALSAPRMAGPVQS